MADTDSSDRPATELLEIEITPEMIEAGVIELARFSPECADYVDVVADIFRAMSSVRKVAHAGREELLSAP